MNSIISKLENIEGVTYIHRIRDGAYDLILKINGNDRNELGDKVSDICKFKNVHTTVSLIVI